MPPRDRKFQAPGYLRDRFDVSPGEQYPELDDLMIDEEFDHLLDHHDLSSLDYTPGGTIEQSVHTQFSNANRAAYRDAMFGHDEHAADYEQSLDEAFERAAAIEDAAYEEQELGEEARDEAIRAKDEQVKQAAARQAIGEAVARDQQGQPMTGAEMAQHYADRARQTNREMTDADYGVSFPAPEGSDRHTEIVRDPSLGSPFDQVEPSPAERLTDAFGRECEVDSPGMDR
jgi:hypothetical protein